jgi:hypothetical protein
MGALTRYAIASFPMEGVTPPSIVLYKKFDERQTEYTGRYDIKLGKSLWTRKGLDDFVQLEGTPSYYEWLCVSALTFFPLQSLQHHPASKGVCNGNFEQPN